MRYRRLSYRYAVLVASGEPRQLGAAGFLERQGVRLAQPSWRPAADVYESAERLFATVDLAGVDPEGVEVLIFEDALVVEGERRVPPPVAGGVYHAAEIRQGRFRLELPLPARVDPEEVEAGYDQGLLRIALAKAKGR